MKCGQTNKYTAIGIFIVGVTLLLKHLLGLPEIINGFGLGLGIALEFVGLIDGCREQNRLRKFKSSILRNVTGGSEL